MRDDGGGGVVRGLGGGVGSGHRTYQHTSFLAQNLSAAVFHFTVIWYLLSYIS